MKLDERSEERHCTSELVVTTAQRFSSCAEHVRQLGGASPLSNLMEVKD